MRATVPTQPQTHVPPQEFRGIDLEKASIEELEQFSSHLDLQIQEALR